MASSGKAHRCHSSRIVHSVGKVIQMSCKIKILFLVLSQSLIGSWIKPLFIEDGQARANFFHFFKTVVKKKIIFFHFFFSVCRWLLSRVIIHRGWPIQGKLYPSFKKKKQLRGRLHGGATPLFPYPYLFKISAVTNQGRDVTRTSHMSRM